MSRFQAVVIPPPGEDGVVLVRRVQVDGDSGRWLNEQVGGYFEHLLSEDGKTDFWMNEDGKFNGSGINLVASEVLYDLYPAFRGHDILHGTVVLTGNRGPNIANVPVGTWRRLPEIRYTMPWSFGQRVSFLDSSVVANA